MGSRLLLLLQERFSSLVEKDDLDEVLKSKDDILRWTVELTKYLVRPALPLCDDCASMHCSALRSSVLTALHSLLCPRPCCFAPFFSRIAVIISHAGQS